MALTDQVLMPGSDYQAICDATRNLTGKTETLKSGDISTELETVTPQSETWVLGLGPSSSSGATGTFSTIFTSSYYSNMIFYGIKCSAIRNGYKIVFYTNSEKTSIILPYSNGWGNDNIRKLTFKNPPTDTTFLSWLNVWQGEKQNTDLAVCSEDSIAIHNTPYVYTPEHPYDGTKKLNITISPTTQATPSISVNADGLITASATQSAGYVTAGTKSATKQLPTVDTADIAAGTSLSLYSMRQEVGTSDVSAGIAVTSSTNEIANSYVQESSDSTTVVYVPIPTETKTVALSMASGNQTVINSTGEKLMTAVTVQKPSTLIPSNIKKGVDIGGVVGAIPEIDATNLLDGVLASNGSVGIAGDEAKMDVYLSLDPSATLAEGHMILPELGSAVKSVTIPTEDKNFAPSFNNTAPYRCYPSSGKLLSSVTVLRDANLVDSNILLDKKIYGVKGSLVPSHLVRDTLISDGIIKKATTLTIDAGFISFNSTIYYKGLFVFTYGDVYFAFGTVGSSCGGMQSKSEGVTFMPGVYSVTKSGSTYRYNWMIAYDSMSYLYGLGSCDIYGVT